MGSVALGLFGLIMSEVGVKALPSVSAPQLISARLVDL